MKVYKIFALIGFGLFASSGFAAAQTAAGTSTPASKPQGPTSLSIYFPSGSYALSQNDEATLDEATRIFNAGKPIVMTITGMTDATGAPSSNLLLSQKRANMVYAGLMARGLPAAHFQILAKGATDTLSGDPDQGSDQALRKVEITWR